MIKNIIDSATTISYELKFTHPDYGSNYVTAIVEFDDDDETDLYLQNLHTYVALWDRYNKSGFYHTMKVDLVAIWIDDTVIHKTCFEGSKYDLIAMINDYFEKPELWPEE